MYDELIKALRSMSKMGMKYGMAVVKMREAADAIEELNSQLDDFKRLCLPLKENSLYKYSDGRFMEVFLMILPSEPPKGEDNADTTD